jgi:hypothetical protein
MRVYSTEKTTHLTPFLCPVQNQFAVPAASVTTPAFDGGSGARTLSLDSGDAEHDETQEETAVDLTDDGPGREESTDAGLGAEDATEESRVKVSKLHDSDSSMKWNECSSASPSAVGADDEREEDDDWGTFDATNAPESSGSVASASEKIPAGPSLATESDEKGTKSSPSEDAFGFGNEEDDDFNDFAAVKSGEGDNEDADDDFGGFAEAPPKDDGDDDVRATILVRDLRRFFCDPNFHTSSSHLPPPGLWCIRCRPGRRS